MLETENNVPTLGLGGLNQQDFKELQLVAGGYPNLIGLQQRFPGKSLQQIFDGPVGSIYVFYNVYGRTFTLTDFGSLQITPIEPFNITLPGLPPSLDEWFDDFSGYEVDLVSRIWGAGIWDSGVGICETLIQGFIDPFLVFATLSDLPAGVPFESQKPIKVLPPIDSPEITPADPSSPEYSYPPGSPQPDLIIKVEYGTLIPPVDYEGLPVAVHIDDLIHYYEPPGTLIDTLAGSTVPTGGVTLFHGLRVGRVSHDFGLAFEHVDGFPDNPGYPPPPVATNYYLYPGGVHGVET